MNSDLAGNLLDPRLLSKLRQTIEEESDVIVEHRFCRGSRAPYRFVCSDFDRLLSYLEHEARVGDSLYFWSFERCCIDDKILGHAKKPDANGNVPEGGAY
jgi:hypothetical protein